MTAVTKSIEYIDDAVNGIESLYPSYGNAPDIVADTLIGIIIDNHNEAKESSDA